MVVLSALFLALSEPTQQSFYKHFWTHLLVANVLGMGVSVCFHASGGDEKYARCVTRDQVFEGKLKQPVALSASVPEATRFFLGGVVLFSAHDMRRAIRSVSIPK